MSAPSAIRSVPVSNTPAHVPLRPRWLAIAALSAGLAAAANISIVGGHLYGGVPNYPGAAEALGKEVWMTEHYLESVNQSATRTSWATSIDDAIALAKEIHDGMTLAQYNAYVYWWLVNSKPVGVASLAPSCEQALVQPAGLAVTQRRANGQMARQLRACAPSP